MPLAKSNHSTAVRLAQVSAHCIRCMRQGLEEFEALLISSDPPTREYLRLDLHRRNKQFDNERRALICYDDMRLYVAWRMNVHLQYSGTGAQHTAIRVSNLITAVKTITKAILPLVYNSVFWTDTILRYISQCLDTNSRAPHNPTRLPYRCTFESLVNDRSESPTITLLPQQLPLKVAQLESWSATAPTAMENIARNRDRRVHFSSGSSSLTRNEDIIPIQSLRTSRTRASNPGENVSPSAERERRPYEISSPKADSEYSLMPGTVEDLSNNISTTYTSSEGADHSQDHPPSPIESVSQCVAQPDTPSFVGNRERRARKRASQSSTGTCATTLTPPSTSASQIQPKDFNSVLEMFDGDPFSVLEDQDISFSSATNLRWSITSMDVSLGRDHTPTGWADVVMDYDTGRMGDLLQRSECLTGDIMETILVFLENPTALLTSTAMHEFAVDGEKYTIWGMRYSTSNGSMVRVKKRMSVLKLRELLAGSQMYIDPNA